MKINRLNGFVYPKGATHFLLAILVLLSLSACEFETPTPVLSDIVPEGEVEGPTEEPAEDVVVMETDVPAEEPVETEVSIETEAPTESPPTEEPFVCVELLAPENAAELPAVGKVAFE